MNVHNLFINNYYSWRSPNYAKNQFFLSCNQLIIQIKEKKLIINLQWYTVQKFLLKKKILFLRLADTYGLLLRLRDRLSRRSECQLTADRNVSHNIVSQRLPLRFTKPARVAVSPQWNLHLVWIYYPVTFFSVHRCAICCSVHRKYIFTKVCHILHYIFFIKKKCYQSYFFN